MTNRKQKVSIVRVEEQNTYSALERAVELIEGIEDIIPPGSKVLVKPNLVMSPTERCVTSPFVLEAVLRLVSRTSPKEITIAEGSGDSYTWSAFRINNIYDMATRYEARIVDLNMDEGIRTRVSSQTGRDYVMLPKTAAEADVVISIPVFKLWGKDLPMSISLKNLFGFYGARYYGHNKNSYELATTDPIRTLSGEIGTERGIHYPTVEQSIAAINLARTSDLTVVDALEGSNGKGNYIRMDTLIVGKNPVATDSVALMVAGLVPEQSKHVQMCSDMGLGPCRLEDIDVVGEPIEKVRFDLARLNENVLEMPLDFCLARMSMGELGIIGHNLKIYGFLAKEAPLGTTKEEAICTLMEVMEKENYIEKALELLPETGWTVLDIIMERGGTSGNYFDILHTYTDDTGESNSFWVGLRSMIRLGLAYVFHGQYKSYVLLAEGVVGLAHERARTASTPAVTD